MKKKILVSSFILATMALIALLAVFYYWQNKNQLSVPGQKLSLEEQIQAVETRLEQDKQAAINKIRQDYESKRIEINQSRLTGEEKTAALAKLDQEMNQELTSAIYRLNQEADQQIAAIKKIIVEQKKQSGTGTNQGGFIGQATAEEVGSGISILKIDQAELEMAQASRKKIEEFLELEKFYRENPAEAEKITEEKISQIRPDAPLPGQYFNVPIE